MIQLLKALVTAWLYKQPGLYLENRISKMKFFKIF